MATSLTLVRGLPRVAAAVALVAPGPSAQELVADINQAPGASESAYPRHFLALGGSVYFSANAPGVGRELVATDGVTTALVADIELGAGSSSPSNLVQLDASTFLFEAETSATGRELWRSDGTASATALVADIHPGPLGSMVVSALVPGFTLHAGRVYFVADDGAHGRELWSSDGLTAKLELDLAPGPQGTEYYELVSSGSHLFFTTSDGLFSYDGTAALFLHGFGYSLLDFGGTLLFTGESPAGFEVFSSDGTAAGTGLLLDLAPGAASSHPRQLFVHGGDAYFAARPSSPTVFLYKTDGTPAGTVPLKALESYPSLTKRAALGDDFVFIVGTDCNTQFYGCEEVWKTDGTPVGTQQISGFGFSAPMVFDAELSNFVVAGGAAYFMAYVEDAGIFDSTLGYELWSTDGDSVGLVVDLYLGPGHGISPTAWTAGLDEFAAPLGGELVFAGDDSHGHELWRTDGTAAGTVLLADLDPPDSNLSSFPRDLRRLGTAVVFAAEDGIHGRELWISDGTEPGTRMLGDLKAGFLGSGPIPELVWGDLCFFSATGELGLEPWVTDGTPEGTKMLGDLHQGIFGSKPDGFLPFGDAVLFAASEPPLGFQLWSTDGTPAGTERVTSTPGSIGLDPTELVEFQGAVYFSGYDPVAGYEILKTDGTAAGTTLAVEVWPGSKPQSAGNRPTNLVVVGDTLFFFADDGATGRELYATDGTQAGTVALELAPGADGIYPYGAVGFGDRLGFVAFEPALGREVWVSDGTLAGTVNLVDLDPGPGNGAGLHVRAAGETLLFVGADATQPGTDALWASDGTAAGTQALLQGQSRIDLDLGNDPVGSGERVLFRAEDAAGGPSLLWVTDGATAAPLHEGHGDVARALGNVLYTGTSGGAFDTGAELYRFPFADTGDWAIDPLGAGCPLASGTAPAISAAGAAKSGQAIQVGLESTAPSAPALLLAGVAGSPIQVTEDCVLQESVGLVLASTAITDAGGGAAVPLVMPAGPAWHGLPVAVQWLVVQAGGGIPGLGALSDALEVVIGP